MLNLSLPLWNLNYDFCSVDQISNSFLTGRPSADFSLPLCASTELTPFSVSLAWGFPFYPCSCLLKLYFPLIFQHHSWFVAPIWQPSRWAYASAVEQREAVAFKVAWFCPVLLLLHPLSSVLQCPVAWLLVCLIVHYNPKAYKVLFLPGLLSWKAPFLDLNTLCGLLLVCQRYMEHSVFALLEVVLSHFGLWLGWVGLGPSHMTLQFSPQCHKGVGMKDNNLD